MLHSVVLGLALAGAIAEAGNEPGPARLIALDVGEGQAILLARGEHGMLIDTGRVGMGRHVLDRLRHHGIEKLETIVYTHPHPDHVGSWFRVHEAFPDVRVIENGHRRPGTQWPDTSRWVANALDALPDDRHSIVGAGDRWQWRGLEFQALWPEDTRGGSLNGRSLVLEIGIGELTVLHMGDVGQTAETALLEGNDLPASVDVLVAGHHGSADTSSRPFLAHVHPEYALVSTDRNNIRGYPDANTIRRLRAHSEHLLRTWVDGEICLRLAPAGDMGRCRGHSTGARFESVKVLRIAASGRRGKSILDHSTSRSAVADPDHAPVGAVGSSSPVRRHRP